MIKRQPNKLLPLCSVLFAAISHADTVPVSLFEKEGLAAWKQKSFIANTQYSLVESNGGKALKAISHASASGLFKKIRIDLEKTPWLNWSWRIENTLNGPDERTKAGDDYPARVYIIVDGGVFFWSTKVLSFVWSSNQAKGSYWPNAYTKKTQMIAVQSGTQKLGQWVTEKRNIQVEFQNHFGEHIRYIDAVALMSDTDNTKQTVTAYYQKLFFSSD